MIDPSKPTAHLPQLSAKLPAATAQAQSLAALLGVKVGQAVAARVLEASPLSDAERRFLGNQAKQALEAKSPQAKAELARAAVAEATHSQLLRVLIKQHTLALVSDLKIDASARITVKVSTDGRLELVAPRPAPAEPGQAPSTTSTSSAPAASGRLAQPIKQAALQPLPQRASSSDAPLEITPRTQLAKEKLVHHYGRELPPADQTARSNPTSEPPRRATQEQQLRQQLFEALQTTLPRARSEPAASERVMRSLEALPEKVPASLRRELPEFFALLKNLTLLKQTTLDTRQLRTLPLETMRDALQRSGVLLEHRLRETAPADGQAKPIVDAKLATLAALANVEQLLASGGAKQLPEPGKTLLDPLLKLFLSMKTPDGPTPKSPSRLQDALQVLQTQLRATLAQIQTQQYRTAATFIGESSPTPPSLLLELPIRWFDGFGTVVTLWQEFKRPEESRKERREGRAKKQYWRVYLELDLADDGMLGADLGVCDKHMDVRMWADRQALAERAQTGLDHLRAQLKEQGLNVCDLSCAHTANPERPVQMHCTLIDERT